MKNLSMFALLLLAFPLLVSAQKLEVSGGYTHTSGDGGLDGFNIGAAAWITNRISLAVDYDTGSETWNLSRLDVTPTGGRTTKSHVQSCTGGSRLNLPGPIRIKGRQL